MAPVDVDVNDQPPEDASPSGNVEVPVPVSWLRRGPGLVLIAGLAFVVVIAGFVAVAAMRYRNQQNQPPRLTGIPASVSSSLADLMAL